jgi:hypothetical protein
MDNSYGHDARSERIVKPGSNVSLANGSQSQHLGIQKRMEAMQHYQYSAGRESRRVFEQAKSQSRSKVITRDSAGTLNANHQEEVNERFELDSDCNVDLEEADELNSDRAMEQGQPDEEEQKNQSMASLDKYIKNGFIYTQKRFEEEADSSGKFNGTGNFNDLMN